MTSVILWDVATQQPIGQPSQRLHHIRSGEFITPYSVAFSPDGKTLVYGKELIGSIMLWDMATHQPIGEPLNGQASDVQSVAFTPDGKILLQEIGIGHCILWDVALVNSLLGSRLIGIQAL